MDGKREVADGVNHEVDVEHDKRALGPFCRFWAALRFAMIVQGLLCRERRGHVTCEGVSGGFQNRRCHPHGRLGLGLHGVTCGVARTLD